MSRTGAPTADVGAAASAVFREEAGRLTAWLTRILGDFAVAEEVAQDTILVALERWAKEGIPRRPRPWLYTTARRRAINTLRRDASYQQKLRLLQPVAADEGDDRLRLLFTCCHPALGRDSQVALTLRAVCGLTTAEIARALLVSEPAIAQRIVRARRKIVDSRIPYRVPGAGELGERLNEVLTVLYLVFNEGYLASGGVASHRRDLMEDAIWLTSLASGLLPGEPEPLGLLALMSLQAARGSARFGRSGRLVLLRDQDRSLWNREQIARAVELLRRAAALKRPGPYQVQAAIAAVHADSPSFQATDWRQIVALYDMLLGFDPSPVVRLNRAIAVAQFAGPDAALAEVDALQRQLDGYHLFHATRGQLLTELGELEQARAAQLRALDLTNNWAERALLRERLGLEE